MKDVTLEPFGPEHLDGALALSRQAGWPHRREDWALLHVISRGTVLLAAGRVIGTAFCTPFGANLAAINMIIVDEAERGHGLGRRLMREAMAAAGNRTMRLVATADGRKLYEKLGFFATGQVAQHQGMARAVPKPEGVTWAGPSDHDEIAALDREAFGADRGALFARILPVGQTATIRAEGRLLGFAVCRPFGRGYVIGPMVAPGLEEAKRLAATQIASHPDTFLRVDTDAESGLGDWLVGRALLPAGGGTVMYRGRPPHTVPNCPLIFALAAQALG